MVSMASGFAGFRVLEFKVGGLWRLKVLRLWGLKLVWL